MNIKIVQMDIKIVEMNKTIVQMGSSNEHKIVQINKKIEFK